MSNSQTSPLDESLFTFDYNSLQQEIESAINANYIDYIDDECFDGDGAFDGHDDVEMSDESGFDKEVPKEDKVEVTSCVIIDNDKNHEMIERCNRFDMNRSIYNLIGSFEVDSDVVKEVGDKVEKLGVCLKHLNYDQNTLHRPQIGESRIKASLPFSHSTIHKKRCLLCNKYKCFYSRGEACQQHLWNVCGRNIQIPCHGLHDCPAITPHSNLSSIPENMQRVRYICTDCLTSHGGHLHARPGSGKRSVSCVQSEKHHEDSTSSLKLIAKFINNIALSTDNNAKNNLLNLLINVIKDFNETPSETTSLDSAVTTSSNNQMIPSFFLLNVIFALRKFSINEDREINQLNPDTFENYGKNLAISVWKSYTIVKENQKSLENPGSLDEYHKAMPKNLTSFFIEINLDQDGPNEMVIEPVLEQSSPMDINETN
ncbi:14686_t:CDS:2, partial [Entrophospora sp. SA101]